MHLVGDPVNVGSEGLGVAEDVGGLVVPVGLLVILVDNCESA